MRALLPDALLPDAWRLQERTGLLVGEDGRIAALAAEADLPAGDWTRFPGETWCAAPVLAHAHAEGHDAPSGGFRRAPFCAWIEDLVAWRGTGEALPTADSARAVQAELAAAGCGAVLALFDARAPDSAAAVPDGGLPEWIAAPECLAPDPSDAEAWSARLAPWLQSGRPVALHAPYSVSEALATRVFRAAAGRAPVSVHLAETPEERALLSGGDGGDRGLAALMARLGDAAKRARCSSPVDWLAEVGGLQPGTLAVHCGDLDVGELQRLSASGVRAVFCPGTHAWFDRPAPRFVEAGVPLPALGCDSRASNDALDPLRELRLAHAMMPAPGAQAWWHAATVAGAEALARPDLGRLLPGRRMRALRIANVPGERAADACARLASSPQVLGLNDGARC